MAGMPRDFVKEQRGDMRQEAIDIYNHIDKKGVEVEPLGPYTTVGDLTISQTEHYTIM